MSQAGMPSTSNPKLADLCAAFRRIPTSGVLRRFYGPFNSAGLNTHIQGAIALPGYEVLSYSDQRSDHGIMLMLQMSDGELWQTVPIPNELNCRLYHAGGIQQFGDVIAVPSETQDGFSAVVFLSGRKLVDEGVAAPIARPIPRRTKDAMAVGITDIVFGGQSIWIAGVFQKGRIDFYRHNDLLDLTIEWRFAVSLAVKQKEHR
jgi:hypothetical protein